MKNQSAGICTAAGEQRPHRESPGHQHKKAECSWWHFWWMVVTGKISKEWKEREASIQYMEAANKCADTYVYQERFYLNHTKSKEALAGCSSNVTCKESREQAAAFCLGNFQFPCLISAIDLNGPYIYFVLFCTCSKYKGKKSQNKWQAFG